jgi:hypothetical protein
LSDHSPSFPSLFGEIFPYSIFIGGPTWNLHAEQALLKDTVNRVGDLVDDGVPNHSFKG